MPRKGVRVQERLEFNEGDVGLAGGIQADDDSVKAMKRTTQKICYLNPMSWVEVLFWNMEMYWFNAIFLKMQQRKENSQYPERLRDTHVSWGISCMVDLRRAIQNGNQNENSSEEFLTDHWSHWGLYFYKLFLSLDDFRCV